MKGTLSVKVISPGFVLYDGQAAMVSSQNKTGRFDIIPGHANFISLIESFLTLTFADKKQNNTPIQGGILYCQGDTVRVFLGIPASNVSSSS